MLWPENQIRLGVGSTTPRITSPVVPGPSSYVAADPNLDMQMAQDPNDDDDVNIDAYINIAYGDDLNDIEELAAGPSEKRPTIVCRSILRRRHQMSPAQSLKSL
jgi:hypothetical protein